MRTDPYLPFQAHSPTSRRAAVEGESAAETQRKRVLMFLQDIGESGATDEEMQLGLGMVGNTQRPRRVELFRADLICDSGRTRPTRSGRLAVVWMAKEKS